MLNFFFEAKMFTGCFCVSIVMMALLVYSAIKKPEIPFVDPVYFFSKMGAVFSIVATVAYLTTNVMEINPSGGWLIISVTNALIFSFVLSKKSHFED